MDFDANTSEEKLLCLSRTRRCSEEIVRQIKREHARVAFQISVTGNQMVYSFVEVPLLCLQVCKPTLAMCRGVRDAQDQSSYLSSALEQACLSKHRCLVTVL